MSKPANTSSGKDRKRNMRGKSNGRVKRDATKRLASPARLCWWGGLWRSGDGALRHPNEVYPRFDRVPLDQGKIAVAIAPSAGNASIGACRTESCVHFFSFL